jgi:16S rRNA (guanine527-N7)-methyltransferase
VEDLLRRGLPELGIPADEKLVAAFAGFLQLLAQWNENINLTGIRAGLPGIPLALTEPDRHFTLVDGTLKKIRFVRQAIADLGLANAEALHTRIEDHNPVPLYDTVICRALSPLPDFVRRAGRCVAPGGQLLAMKGKLPTAEPAALPAGWRVEAVTPVRVPGLDAERHIIQVTRGQVVRT